MKRILSLLIIPFLCACAVQRQAEQGDGANTIILTMECESPEEAHDLAIRSLIDNGVEVLSYDQEYFLINASGKQTRSGSLVTCTFYFRESSEGVVARVTGTYLSPTDGFMREGRVIKRGMDGSIQMQVWDSMFQTALLIPHSNVTFENIP